MSDNHDQKKKRRQNVACDSCKFRRIKCDLVSLLCPPELIDDPPSLSQLVLEHPGVSCSNCKNKGLDCTTEQILNPTKPNKGGKRIEEARKKFGSASAPAEDSDERVDEAGTADGVMLGQPSGSSYGFGGVAAGVSADQFATMGDSQDWSSLFLSSMQQASGSGSSQNSASFEPSVSLNDLPPEFRQYMAQSEPDPFQAYTISSDDALNAPMPSIGPSNGAWAHHFDAGVSPATRFSAPSTIPPTNVVTPRTPPREALDDHLSRHYLNLASGSSTYLQSGSRTILPHHVYSDPVPGMLTTAQSPERLWQSRPSTSTIRTNSSGTEDAQSQYGAGVPTVQQLLMKRKRETQQVDFYLPKEEAWRIWSRVSDPNYGMRWGRLEHFQERLADRALGIELSRHLIKVFFQAVYFSFPAISPEAFYLEWVRADERSDRMTPQQEALCACIEAWGARYSDSPVVLGLEPEREKEAPKVITADGKFLPGTQARLHWGKARQTVCKALMHRAQRFLDDNAIFRKPTITGFQALLLYHQLQHTDTSQTLSHEHWMGVQMVHSALADQMEILNLLWTSKLPMPQDEREVPLPAPQQRIRQRRLYFGYVVGDAYYAAAAGKLPKIDEEDIDAAHAWMNASVAALPPSGLRCLAISMQLYIRLTKIGRRIARELTYPGQKKGAIDVPEMCQTVREAWTEIKSILTDVSTQFGGSLETCPEPLWGFSPLSYLANIRLGAPFFLLVIHQLIREQIEFRKELGGSYIIDERAGGRSPQQEHIAALETLRLQGVDVMLQICRSETALLAAVVPSGMLQSASIFTGVIIAVAQFMAEVPTNEQGYPSDTLGGYGWTWEQKQKDMQHCTDTLHQIGWSWPEVANILDNIHLAMERMQPTPEQLAGYLPPVQDDVRAVVAAQQEQTREDEARVVDIAMQYWPPLSLSNLARRSFQGHLTGAFLQEDGRFEASERREEPDQYGEIKVGMNEVADYSFTAPEGINPQYWSKLVQDPWVDALTASGAKKSLVFGPGTHTGPEDQTAWFETALHALDTMDARHAASTSASGSAATSPSKFPSNPSGGTTRSQTPDDRPSKVPKTRPHPPPSALANELNTRIDDLFADQLKNGLDQTAQAPPPQFMRSNQIMSQDQLGNNLTGFPAMGTRAEGTGWDFDFANLELPTDAPLESPGEAIRAFESFLQGINDNEDPVVSQ